jgi:hypothetical protein
VVGEYRVNNVFVMMGQVRQTTASTVMGFLPSNVWRALPDVATYLDTLQVSGTAFQALLMDMKRLSLSALVVRRKSIRVILFGIGDNQSGLIFLRGQPVPARGEHDDNGRRYRIVEQLEPGIVFYETD